MAVKGGRSLSNVDLSENVEARETQVDSLLADRVARFLGTHTLQFKVPKDSIEDMQRSLEEGRCPATKLIHTNILNYLIANG